MRFGIFTSLTNSTWDDVLTLWRHSEATGWDAACVTDHFMPNTKDRTGNVLECWTTLAALAPMVPRIRIGTIVVGNTYRHPAVVAKMAATVDVISGGRLILGLGAAWQENEHAAYGIPFYTVGERLARLDEACRVIRALWTQSKATLDGKVWLPEIANATHYHAYWVSPWWVRTMRKMTRIGVHSFYRPRRWGDGEEAPSWGSAAVTAETAAKL